MIALWNEARRAIASARAAIITGLCVAALCLPTAYCVGRNDGRARAELESQRETVRVLEDKSAADAEATERRRADEVRISETERSLKDAIAKGPDGRPGAASVRLNCQRLRNAGVETASIPECQ